MAKPHEDRLILTDEAQNRDVSAKVPAMRRVTASKQRYIDKKTSDLNRPDVFDL